VEKMLRQAVEAGPSNYRARVALAWFELAHNNPEEARRGAEAAVAIDGTRVDGFAALASVYAGRGQNVELDAVLATAEKQVPDDLLPYYRAGDTLLRAGRDLDRAERYLRRYLAAEPEGNEPTLAEARRKVEQISEKRNRSMRAQRFYKVEDRPDR
jgi:Tfp pilus assembly protein PilF